MLTHSKKRMRSLALFLVFLMLSSVISFAAEPTQSDENYKTGTFNYIHDADTDLTDTYVYSDSWFTSSAYKENPQLRTVSLIASMASANSTSEKDYLNKSKNIKAFLSDIGFQDIAVNDFYKVKPTESSAGCCIGRKTITVDNESYTLLAIIPRSEGYEAEWISNFTVGKSGLHEGFKTARDEVLRFAQKYVKDYNITGNLKVWIAGHSRGAAIANLTAGFLVDFPAWLGKLNPENIYAYTFGTPSGIPKIVKVNDENNPINKVTVFEKDSPGNETVGGDDDVDGITDEYITPKDSRYNCIHNCFSAGDFFAKVAPDKWYFTRYGTDTVLDAGLTDVELPYMCDIAPEGSPLFNSPTFGDPAVPFAEKTISMGKNGFELTDVKNSTLSAEKFIEDRITYMVNAVDTDGTTARATYVDSGYEALLKKVFTITNSDSFDMTKIIAQIEDDPDFAAKLVYAVGSVYIHNLYCKAQDLDAGSGSEENLKYVKDQVSTIGLAALSKPDVLAEMLKGFLGDTRYSEDLIKLLVNVDNPTRGGLAIFLYNCIKGNREEYFAFTAKQVKNFFDYTFPESESIKFTDEDAANAVRILSNVVFGNNSKKLELPIISNWELIQESSGSNGTIPEDAVVIDPDTPELNTAATIFGNIAALGREHINAALLARMRAQDSCYNIGKDPGILDNPFKNPFIDVSKTAYYAKAVNWATKNNITLGTSDVTFSPDLDCSRAQFVTFLWRASGCPEPAENAGRFADVKAGSYCEKAVAWAVEQGITKGTSSTKFSPDATCKRCQVVSFLARLAGVKDAETESVFTDVKTSDYFAATVKWAKDNGIAQGTSAATFSPYANCSRAQAVTFLYRLKTIQ